MRLRVISTRPSSEMSNTWVRVLSRARASRNAAMTCVAVLPDLHVDEVDDDDPADVAQAQLAGDLLGRLEVVAEDRLLEARRAHVLAGVDVDDGERLGVLDDERAARRQPHLAVEGLVELLVHVVALEQRQRPRRRGRSTRPGRPASGLMRGDVVAHLLVQGRVVDDDAAVVVVELLADDPHGHVGLAVEQRRRRRPCLASGVDLLPLAEQPGDVALDLLGGDALGRGAHDEAVLGRLDLVEDRRAGACARRRAGAWRCRRCVLLGMSTTNRPGSDTSWVRRAPLGPIGFLVTWQRMRLAGLEDLLDARAARPRSLDVLGVVLDVAPVEHGVLGRADVDERRLHAGQHVLDLAEVDVAVDLGDVVGRAATRSAR